MEFRIADTFTNSLARLNGDEQKAAKTAAFDLQVNPANPGLQFHKLDAAKDKRFASVRVNRDIRIIVHRSVESFLLCYVGHHDDAYRWGERRKLETHPKTGAAQLVEIRERVEEITIPKYVEAPVAAPDKPRLFAGRSEDEILGLGVPPEWVGDVMLATEDSLLRLVEHLPAEAAEALFALAVGEPVAVAAPFAPKPASDSPEGQVQFSRRGVDGRPGPFEHPDAQRRFRTIQTPEELQRALDYPWEAWTIFLHPDQRALVEREFNGPARISGSAGTGKTIVALHRAVHLARRHPGARVLLTTFSEALASALNARLKQLAGNEPDVYGRVQVAPIHRVAFELYVRTFGEPAMAMPEEIRNWIAGQKADDPRLTPAFLLQEWTEIVDARQLGSWDDYRNAERLGRRTRLGPKQREAVWGILSSLREYLDAQGKLTPAAVLNRMTEHLAALAERPFDFVVADEAQDLGVQELRFLSALGRNNGDGLFFAGDLGQRIFQLPFSWKALGVDVRGRSSALRVNYRTSHQIRTQADRLLPASLSDVDGNVENRRGTVSVFNGPPPLIRTFGRESDEIEAVAGWLVERIGERGVPHELGVFVRGRPQLGRARAAIERAGLKAVELDDRIEIQPDRVALCTMHLAKGLEFRAVAVMACDAEVIPLQERVEAVTDESDLEEVYNTERHLLYVACTRARDQLWVSGIEPESEFLADMLGK